MALTPDGIRVTPENAQEVRQRDELKNYTKEELMILAEAKDDSKEAKETMKKPELESDNHKIDQGKSKKEKLSEGWKEEERLADINDSATTIKVLKKKLAPGAFVWEYQNDGKIPKHLVGEQLFNWKAVLNLGLEKKLPTLENIKTMRGDTKEENQNFLKNNFQKDGENMFPGYCNPYDHRFYFINERTDCWLADGTDVTLDEDDMGHHNSNDRCWFSLRLLKN